MTQKLKRRNFPLIWDSFGISAEKVRKRIIELQMEEWSASLKNLVMRDSGLHKRGENDAKIRASQTRR